MNNIFYIVIIFLLIIMLVNILSFKNHNYYEINEDVEGFTIPGLSNMGDSINKLTSVANSIPNEINNIKSDIGNSVNNVQKIGNNITGQIDDKLTNFLNEVDSLITKKIKSFFTQFGDVLNDGIVKPIIALFKGIGYIFLGIFNILKEFANKLISLPGCIIIYAITSFFDTLYYIYSLICPTFIRKPIDYVYNIIIRTPINYILSLIGLSSSINKCYSFNIQDDLEKMNNQLSDINTSFKNDFGRLDFNSINI